MSALLPFILLFAAFTVIGIIIALANKENEKTDKGFQLVYLKLSYRRRIKRDLLLVPVVLAIFLAIYYAAIWRIEIIAALVLFTLVVYGVQFAYNIRMWKKHEKNV